MIPFSESVGDVASLQRVACIVCGASLGARVCRPALVNLVALECCRSCAVSSATAGRDRHSLVSGECLEGVSPLTCGARADAGSPALPSPGNKSLGSIEAASVLLQTGRKPAATELVKGTMTPGAQASAVLEHPSHGPAASFSFSARPLFWTVTGYDFARSIVWARRHGNPVSDKIRDHKRRFLS